MFTRDVGANVPLYGQEHCTWCGAASGQMVRNGYPNAADRLFYTQLAVWNAIQARNSTIPADVSQNWATDPTGLTACLQSLNNPAGVHWVTHADTSRDAVLFYLMYWMNRLQYPSPVLINRGGHWAVVVAFTTDVEPISGSTPALQSITVHDPEPHNVGTVSTFTGAQWFSGPWNGAIIYAGSWLNRYVAVVEPPVVKGKIVVRQVRRTGTRVLSPAQAAASAKRWIAKLGLAEQARYALLRHPNAASLHPLLVREEPGGRRAKKVPCYYIVPFGLRDEAGERGGPAARVCVLVNAFTGAFEEATAFGRPVRYLAREEALAVVGSALRLGPDRLAGVEATLMFQPSDITHVRTYPFWRVKVGKRFLYVDQLGKLYGALLPSVPGD